MNRIAFALVLSVVCCAPNLSFGFEDTCGDNDAIKTDTNTAVDSGVEMDSRAFFAMANVSAMIWGSDLSLRLSNCLAFGTLGIGSSATIPVEPGARAAFFGWNSGTIYVGRRVSLYSGRTTSRPTTSNPA